MNVLRANVLVLSLFLAAPFGLFGQDAPTASEQTIPAAATPTKVEAPGITNLSVVRDSSSFAGPLVAFGGATQPQAMDWLEKSGFRTVINLRRASESGAEVDAGRAAAEASGLTYVHLPFDGSTPDPEFVERFLSEVSNADEQPVYIHCASATRVSALWMIARVERDGWDADSAAAEAVQIAGRPESAVGIARSYLNQD